MNEEIKRLQQELERTKADLINSRNELLTLKNEIKSGIEGIQADYEDNKDCEVNEGNFYAFKVSLKQIFRTLKRAGIDIEAKWLNKIKDLYLLY